MRVELIAEVSSNHGGDRGLMAAFIAQYAEAGADWVKFQSYQVATLRPGDPQLDWLAQAELSDDDHAFLIETCARYRVKFLTTVFHVSRVPFLAGLGLEAIKIGSGEATEWPLASAVMAARFQRTLVSLGVSSETRVPFYRAVEPRLPGETALRDWPPPAMSWRIAAGVSLLHCVSRYPCPTQCAHRSYVAPTVGWSDHARGIEACQVAIMDGARIIEKHVSLPEQQRPKKSWEATVAEFKELRAFADDDPQKYQGRWQHPSPTVSASA